MKDWYRDANKLCAELAVKHGVQTWQVAGILTAMSAQKRWDINVLQTKQFLAGETITHMYSQAQLNAAKRILAGENPLRNVYV